MIYPDKLQFENIKKIPNKISTTPKVKLPNKANGLLPKQARMGKVNMVDISLILVIVRPVYYAKSDTTWATMLLAEVITPFIPVICIIKGI